jgi:hypothetical protein
MQNVEHECAVTCGHCSKSCPKVAKRLKLSEGGQPGNHNARKAPKTAEQLREANKLHMRKRRSLLKQGLVEGYQFAGRPRKQVVKGDIFNVAAILYKALKEYKGPEGVSWTTDQALKVYQDFWEQD